MGCATAAFNRVRTGAFGAFALAFVTMALSPSGSVRAAENDGSNIIGHITEYTAWTNDTLLDLARAEQLGVVELMAANPGVDPWLPGRSTRLVMPTAHILPDAPHRGIVINVAELRLYFFHPTKGIFSFPIGVGREGFSTPIGSTKIVRKKAHPSWYPTASMRRDDPELPSVVPPGPENPLGEYAMYLGFPQYLIHGTSKPWGVGRRVSHGCIRLYPEDIEWLFKNVSVKTPVTIVNQPVKFGHRDGELYVEVHPTFAQIDQIEENGNPDPAPIADPVDIVTRHFPDDVTRIDWQVVQQAFTERRGYPIRISQSVH